MASLSVKDRYWYIIKSIAAALLFDKTGIGAGRGWALGTVKAAHWDWAGRRHIEKAPGPSFGGWARGR